MMASMALPGKVSRFVLRGRFRRRRPMAFFDAAFLPRCAGIAEVGVEAELASNELVAAELSSVVEGDRLSQIGGHGAEHPDKGSCHRIGFQAVLLHGDGEA
ncbi:hypothetical protein BF95_17015 [Sphingobium sp. Ant17]|nr:hypothetical protein BF95_17015 [Sphingobium sp. Ant17]